MSEPANNPTGSNILDTTAADNTASASSVPLPQRKTDEQEHKEEEAQTTTTTASSIVDSSHPVSSEETVAPPAADGSKELKESSIDESADAVDGAEGEGGVEAGGENEEEEEEEEEEEDEDEEDEEEEEEEEEEDEDDYYEELDESTGRMVRKKKHKRRIKKRGGGRFIDDEVEVSTDEEVSSDEELDDDLIAEEDESAFDGLIIDDDEIAADDDEETRKRKLHSKQIKRRRRGKGKVRRRKKELRLDEEDYNLIAENLGVQVRRSIDEDIVEEDEEETTPATSESGKRRRLKKDTSQTEGMFVPVVPVVTDATAQLNKQRRQIAEHDDSLALDGEHKVAVDQEDDMDADVLGAAIEPVQENDEELGDDTAMDGDEDEDTDWGERHDRLGGMRHTKLSSLFGDVKHFLSEKKVQRTTQTTEEESEQAQYEVEEISTGGHHHPRKRVEKRKREKLSLADQLQEQQQIIRDTDVPERLQARVNRAVQFYTQSVEQQQQEMQEEAEWLYIQVWPDTAAAFSASSAYGFASSSSSLSVLHTADQRTQILHMLAKILHLLRIEHMEMPYVILYKQDIYSLQGKVMMSEEELWMVDRYDAQWDILQMRRKKLLSLLTRYQLYEQHNTYTTTSAAIQKMIRTSGSPDDLDDIQDYIKYIAVIDTAKQTASAHTINTDAVAAVIAHQADNEAAESKENKEIQRKASSQVIKRRQEYTLIRSAVLLGLDVVADRVGLSARHLAANLALGYKSHLPADTVCDLETVAATYLTSRLTTTDKVINVIISFIALRLFNDPTIRQHVKKLVWQHSVVSTKPTGKALREVDDTHEYAHIIHIDRKPVLAFESNPAQFLLIGKAYKEGYLELTVSVAGVDRAAAMDTSVHAAVQHSVLDGLSVDEGNPVYKQLSDMYLSDSTQDPNAEAWNVYRTQVLHKTFPLLYSLSLTYVKGRLLKQGIEHVIKSAERRLYTHLTAAPYLPPGSSTTTGSSDDRAKNFKIMAGCMGDEQSPSFFVVLNRHGFVLDTLILHFLKSHAVARHKDGSALNEGDRLHYQRKKEDIQRFIQCLDKHHPVLIALDASSLDILSFKQELELKCLVDSPETRVELFDSEIARIYMNSARAEIEFKEYHQYVRLAISLGRRVLDPLSEICGTWQSGTTLTQAGLLTGNVGLLGGGGRGENEALTRRAAVAASSNPLANDVLAMALHPLQIAVPVSQLLAALSRSMIRAVNKVGVDINKLTTRPWLTGPLQFVCGFGPLKAQSFLAQVKRLGFIENRESMKRKTGKNKKQIMADNGDNGIEAEDDGLVGPIIYRNCAGFIKIHRNTEMNTRGILDLMLDQTRIHPERYDLAVQVAREALDIQEEELKAADVEDADDEDEEVALQTHHRFPSDQMTLRQWKLRSQHVAQLMTSKERSNKLDLLDLVQFALMEYEDKGEQILETLQLIKAELILPYDTSHILRPFAPPSPLELFPLLTGESSRSLREGMLIPVVVQSIQNRGVWVKLDCGLRAFLKLENVSSSAPTFDQRETVERDKAVQWLSARVAVGQVLEVRLIKLDRMKLPYDVEVSSKSADRVRYTPSTYSTSSSASTDEYNRQMDVLYGKDEYTISLPSVEQQQEAELQQLRAEYKKRPFIPRAVLHSLFRNQTREEAIAYLNDGNHPPGDLVIRPSSQGTDRLMVTWKVSDDLYAHVEVKESAKGANPLEMGAALSIGTQSFEDLDEIIARFIEPMSRYAQRMIAHKNFRLGSAADVEQILRIEKEQFPRKIPYALSFATDDKGSFRSFVFSFLPTKTVKMEKITVTPKGYGFGGKVIKEPEQVISALKQHIKSVGKPPAAPPAVPATAAATLPRPPPEQQQPQYPSRPQPTQTNIPPAGRAGPTPPPPPPAAAAAPLRPMPPQPPARGYPPPPPAAAAVPAPSGFPHVPPAQPQRSGFVHPSRAVPVASPYPVPEAGPPRPAPQPPPAPAPYAHPSRWGQVPQSAIPPQVTQAPYIPPPPMPPPGVYPPHYYPHHQQQHPQQMPVPYPYPPPQMNPHQRPPVYPTR